MYRVRSWLNLIFSACLLGCSITICGRNFPLWITRPALFKVSCLPCGCGSFHSCSFSSVPICLFWNQYQTLLIIVALWMLGVTCYLPTVVEKHLPVFLLTQHLPGPSIIKLSKYCSSPTREHTVTKLYCCY